jgi:hypothetical protein
MTRDLTATDLPTVEPGRQRTTWRNASECAHRWAANRHAEGKAGNVFFRNGVIYSYGSHFPIARHVRRGRGKNARQFVLFTSRGYSGTTAGHKSDVRRAIPHGATVFTVDNVLADTPAQHLANLKAIGVEAAYALEKAKRARANRDVLSREAAGRVASGNRYAEAVGIRQRLPEPERLAESHAKQTAREKAAAERARKKRAADLAERVAEWEAKLAAWQAGRGENPGYHPDPAHRWAYLRVNKGRFLETNMRAVVPLSAALPVLNSVRTGEPPPDSFEVDRFRLDKIDRDARAVVIGCHRVAFDEIERAARAAGL